MLSVSNACADSDISVGAFVGESAGQRSAKVSHIPGIGFSNQCWRVKHNAPAHMQGPANQLQLL